MSLSIVKLARELIKVASITGDNITKLEVLGLVSQELVEFNYRNFESNGSPSILFFNTPTIPTKFKVILSAHLDVVPGKPEQFIPKIEGDKLWGRGAFDMKSGAAVEIMVFKELAKKVNYPLGLQLVTDEEIGGFNGTKYQLDQGVDTQFALTCESSTKGNIVHKGKGILWMEITFTGKTAHSAYPWDGDNAIRQANVFISSLYKEIGYPQNETHNTTVNVAKVTAPNEAFNKIPNECNVGLDIRFAHSDEETIVKKVLGLLPKTARHKIVVNEPSTFTNPNNHFIKTLVEVAKKQGLNPQLAGAHGGSDMRFYSAKGSSGIEFGPLGEGAHEDNEWVSIASLEKLYNILSKWLIGLS